MGWTGGITRTTGTIVTASMWNNHLGAGGDLDFICDGTRIQNDLVKPRSLADDASENKVVGVASDTEFEFIEAFENEIAVIWAFGSY